MQHQLPQLPYEYNALEPVIDTQTMEIHHTKHHAAYVNNLNDALAKYPDYAQKDLEELLSMLDSLPEDIRTTVRNNGGGHLNHSLFWEVMAPGGKPISERFEKLLSDTFGSLEEFKSTFTKAAMSRFGSGWAWLVKKADVLEIVSTPNQDNPVMQGTKPLLGLDVWEHAYYLKYQNKRADYVSAWWSIVNWEEVEKRLGS